MPRTVGRPCHPGDMLSDLDKRTIEFENTRWKHAGAKDAAIRDTFDESPTRYYQRLDALLKNPEAAKYLPGTVHRLLRLQEARRQKRT